MDAESAQAESVEPKLELASEADTAAIATLRGAAARELTSRFGRGTWSFAADSEAGVRIELQTARVYVARHGGLVIATLRLSEKKPWTIPLDFFTPTARPIYLTTMAVAPAYQRQGIGRGCLAEAKRIARELDATAIRLDSYDANAGAGEFYRKCGYAEVRRMEYHGTPLILFELLLNTATSPSRVG